MKGKLYWTIRHISNEMHNLRFATACWWLSLQVDVLEWRWRLDMLMPEPHPIPQPMRIEEGGRYAVPSL